MFHRDPPPLPDRSLPECGSLADRKRQLVRDELAEAALRLIAYQGFEETTIDQIAVAAGVSRRTFFRYFQSKEDVIVDLLGALGDQVLRNLASRPPDEAPAVSMRQTVGSLVDLREHDVEKLRRLVITVFETPALLARYLERQARWRVDLGTELARRMGVDPATDLGPSVIVATAFAVHETAIRMWAANGGQQDLDALIDDGFARTLLAHD